MKMIFWKLMPPPEGAGRGVVTAGAGGAAAAVALALVLAFPFSSSPTVPRGRASLCSVGLGFGSCPRVAIVVDVADVFHGIGDDRNSVAAIVQGA